MYLDGDQFIARWLSQFPSDADRDRAVHGLIHPDSERRAAQAHWIDLFTMRIGVLGAPARPASLAAMAEALFATDGDRDPQQVADIKFLDRPRDS